jgi:hypothetical protein
LKKITNTSKKAEHPVVVSLKIPEVIMEFSDKRGNILKRRKNILERVEKLFNKQGDESPC